MGLENYLKQCSHTVSQAKNVKVKSGDKMIILVLPYLFWLLFSKHICL